MTQRDQLSSHKGPCRYVWRIGLWVVGYGVEVFGDFTLRILGSHVATWGVRFT